MVEGLVRRTQYWNLPTHTVRAGATGHGESLIDLEEYRDLTYQLTPVGQAARVAVAEVVSRHRFVIRSDPGWVTVCRLVTGVRQDPWADAHRIVPEAPKEESEVGRLLHPELYSAEPDQGLLSQPVASGNESTE